MAKITTLCYIRKKNSVLMLLRDRKEHDENQGKWIGVGGKLEKGESPHDCVRREVFEETGLALEDCRFRGVVTFVSDVYGDEYMMLFESRRFTGELRADCEEGTLRWIAQEDVMGLPMWEGDRLFLPLLLGTDDPIHMKLIYEGDALRESVIY